MRISDWSSDVCSSDLPEKADLIKVVWKSPLIPADPIVWRKNLPDADKETLRSFFADYGVKGENVEAEKKVLAGLDWGPFKESSDRQLLPLRQLELFRETTKPQAAESISADEKQSKERQ